MSSYALDSVDVGILQLKDIFCEMVKIFCDDNNLNKKYMWNQKILGDDGGSSGW